MIQFVYPDNKKNCITCLEPKPFADFHKDRNKSDGLCPVCKACKKIYNQKRRKEQWPRLSAQIKAWQAKNPERNRERCKRYYYKKKAERDVLRNAAESVMSSDEN